ncbi:hypothetical protein ACFWMR_04375 [Amycolatopsis thailandensis]|uniref:hypothetical protein n=1 Tax=Amycolatopsis thailandensis TaxID=589330 RepID=UPI00364811E8
MNSDHHPVTPPMGDHNSPQTALDDPPKRSRLDKVKEIAPLITVLGAIPGAVACLNFASAHHIWPYSSDPLQGLVVGVGLVILCVAFSVRAIAKKRLTTWRVLSCLVAGSVGSALVTVAIVSPSAATASPPPPGPNPSAQTVLTIESPVDNQRVTGGFELRGRLLGPLRAGDTLWVFANDGGNPDADRSGKFTLLRGPCTVDISSIIFTCPVTLAQDKSNSRQVTLTVLSVTAAQTRHFVEDLFAGAQLDQNRNDCGDGRCSLTNKADPRNKNGLPGGKDITVTDHRTIVIPKA